MKNHVLALSAALLLCAGTTHAAPITFTALLSGPAEEPPNASPGTGSSTVIYDSTEHTLRVIAEFTGLLGTTTASHIHGPTALPGEGLASVATQTPSFMGFPLGVSSGSFENTFDLTLASSFRAGFITDSGGTVAAAEARLAAALEDGTAYFNIHSTMFPGGEIRGFLTPASVPEPATAGLVAMALGWFAVARRRRGQARS